MYKTRLLLALLLAIVLVTACNGTGSGDVITETRQVSNFDSIALSGVGDVIVTQSGSESLTIETDDNLMGRLKIDVENGTLTLGFKTGINLITPTRLVFYVDVDDLNSLAISGSGNIETDGLETGHLEATISGSGNIQVSGLVADQVTAKISGSGGINLAGDASAQDVVISGSGKYLAGDLCGASVAVSISGSGDATVCATGSLDSNISGSGSVNYYGRPTINSTSSGSGELNSLGEK